MWSRSGSDDLRRRSLQRNANMLRQSRFEDDANDVSILDDNSFVRREDCEPEWWKRLDNDQRRLTGMFTPQPVRRSQRICQVKSIRIEESQHILVVDDEIDRIDTTASTINGDSYFESFDSHPSMSAKFSEPRRMMFKNKRYNQNQKENFFSNAVTSRPSGVMNSFSSDVSAASISLKNRMESSGFDDSQNSICKFPPPKTTMFKKNPYNHQKNNYFDDAITMRSSGVIDSFSRNESLDEFSNKIDVSSDKKKTSVSKDVSANAASFSLKNRMENSGFDDSQNSIHKFRSPKKTMFKKKPYNHHENKYFDDAITMRPSVVIDSFSRNESFDEFSNKYGVLSDKKKTSVSKDISASASSFSLKNRVESSGFDDSQNSIHKFRSPKKTIFNKKSYNHHEDNYFDNAVTMRPSSVIDSFSRNKSDEFYKKTYVLSEKKKTSATKNISTKSNESANSTIGDNEASQYKRNIFKDNDKSQNNILEAAMTSKSSRMIHSTSNELSISGIESETNVSGMNYSAPDIQQISQEHNSIESMMKRNSEVSYDSLSYTLPLTKERKTMTNIDSLHCVNEKSQQAENELNQSEIDRRYYEEMQAKRTNPPVRRSTIISMRDTNVSDHLSELENEKVEEISKHMNPLRHSNIPVGIHAVNSPILSKIIDMSKNDEMKPKSTNDHTIYETSENVAITEISRTNAKTVTCDEHIDEDVGDVLILDVSDTFDNSKEKSKINNEKNVSRNILENTNDQTIHENSKVVTSVEMSEMETEIVQKEELNRNITKIFNSSESECEMDLTEHVETGTQIIEQSEANSAAVASQDTYESMHQIDASENSEISKESEKSSSMITQEESENNDTDLSINDRTLVAQNETSECESASKSISVSGDDSIDECDQTLRNNESNVCMGVFGLFGNASQTTDENSEEKKAEFKKFIEKRVRENEIWSEEIKKMAKKFVPQIESIKPLSGIDYIQQQLNKENNLKEYRRKLAVMDKKSKKPAVQDGQIKKKSNKLYMKETWITHKLYSFVQERLRPKYDIKTRNRSEKFVKDLATIVNKVISLKKDYGTYVSMLMIEMVRLKLIETHHDFHCFVREYLPYHFRIKSIPAYGRDIPEVEGSIFDPIVIADED